MASSRSLFLDRVAALSIPLLYWLPTTLPVNAVTTLAVCAALYAASTIWVSYCYVAARHRVWIWTFQILEPSLPYTDERCGSFSSVARILIIHNIGIHCCYCESVYGDPHTRHPYGPTGPHITAITVPPPAMLVVVQTAVRRKRGPAVANARVELSFLGVLRGAAQTTRALWPPTTSLPLSLFDVVG